MGRCILRCQWMASLVPVWHFMEAAAVEDLADNDRILYLAGQLPIIGKLFHFGLLVIPKPASFGENTAGTISSTEFVAWRTTNLLWFILFHVNSSHSLLPTFKFGDNRRILVHGERVSRVAHAAGDCVRAADFQLGGQGRGGRADRLPPDD